MFPARHFADCGSVLLLFWIQTIWLAIVDFFNPGKEKIDLSSKIESLKKETGEEISRK